MLVSGRFHFCLWFPLSLSSASFVLINLPPSSCFTSPLISSPISFIFFHPCLSIYSPGFSIVSCFILSVSIFHVLWFLCFFLLVLLFYIILNKLCSSFCAWILCKAEHVNLYTNSLNVQDLLIKQSQNLISKTPSNPLKMSVFQNMTN